MSEQAPSRPSIYTVGHSTRSLEDFLGILKSLDIRRLADVRRFPASRRHPQFAASALGPALESGGIRYRHFEALGGRRSVRPGSRNTAWRVAGFRGYADHMETDEFQNALDVLMEWAGEARTAGMCAEALPFRCHRQLLSDALLVRGVQVLHILGPGRAEPHRLPVFARTEGNRLVYDSGSLDLLTE
jgi:uncharacterized protein (DUF488 family)